MSLLMDALKKAELAKRKAPPDSESPATPPPVTATSGTARPAAPAPMAAQNVSKPSTPDRLPSLPDRLELLDSQFDTPFEQRRPEPEVPLSHPALAAVASLSLQEDAPAIQSQRAAANRDAENSQQREAVQNLFETKQVESSRKTFAIGAGIVTLLAVLAIGGYFWYQLQPKSDLLGAGVLKVPPSMPTPATASMPIAPLPPLATSPPFNNTITGLVADKASTGMPLEKPEKYAAEPQVAQASVPAARKLFQVSKETVASNPTLNNAYDALTRGDDAGAKVAYEQVLGKDPKNVDALAGLAVIAQRAGEAQTAAGYYVQMLDADPRNGVAMAGLMNLQSRLDPAAAETRIKQALATQPDSPALNFSLGNVYARSKRWNEAQQAYFKALSGDPGNPDYLFNLAVSLDQLHQPKLAANYYAQAITAVNSRPGSFDQARASERLQQLQQ